MGPGPSAVSVINRVWILHSSLELGLRRSYFFIINNKTINESPSYIMFRATVPAAMVTNRVSYFDQVINKVAKVADFGHK